MKRKPLKKAVLLDCGPYPFRIMASIGQNPTEINRSLKKLTGCWVKNEVAERDFGLDGDEGYCLPLVKTGNDLAGIFILLLDENKIYSPGTLTHEAFHVTARAFEYIGLDLESNSNNEAWAYFMGDIVDQLVENFHGKTPRKP